MYLVLIIICSVYQSPSCTGNFTASRIIYLSLRYFVMSDWQVFFLIQWQYFYYLAVLFHCLAAECCQIPTSTRLYWMIILCIDNTAHINKIYYNKISWQLLSLNKFIKFNWLSQLYLGLFKTWFQITISNFPIIFQDLSQSK